MAAVVVVVVASSVRAPVPEHSVCAGGVRVCASAVCVIVLAYKGVFPLIIQQLTVHK